MKRPVFYPHLLSFFVSLAILLSGCASTENATRSDDEESEEMVDFGYNKQEKKKVTSSVQTIDAEDFDNLPVNNLEQLLQGRIAGVEVINTPGGFSVRIRGVSTFSGSNEPLYILDGIPFQPGPGGSISGINPRDIESITVLKDAGSTALYGSRGANGVIVITTKRGKR